MPGKTKFSTFSMRLDDVPSVQKARADPALARRDIPRFLQLYREGRLPVDILNSRFIDLDQVNEGFDALDQGEVARQIIKFDI